MLFPVGRLRPARTRLLIATHQALVRAVSVVRDGARVAEVSNTIAQALKSASLQPSADFVGYRISTVPRDVPRIPCDDPGPDGHVVLREGMVLAVIVLAHEGSSTLRVTPDGWGVVSLDSSDSALFSHMVLVQSDGGHVLTDSARLRSRFDR
ncbi:MAG: M24 family metallopeptidase [Acidobacteria bacterium]|nr:M24 family metallopeptidase [Acidobacteriota bacterium]